MDQKPSNESNAGKSQTDRTPAEAVGRALGKAFGRVKRTKVWRETAQSYQDGLKSEGDK